MNKDTSFQLEAANNWLNFAANDINDGIIIFDKDFHIIFMNRSGIERLLLPGAQAEGIEGKALRGVLPTPIGTDLETRLKKVLLQKTSSTFDYNFEGIDYEIYAYPLSNQGLMIFFSEVSGERKITHQKALKQQRILIKSQELVKLGHWSWKLPMEKVEWSDSLAKIYGVTLMDGTIDLQEVLAFVHPDDLKYVNETIEKLILGEPVGPIESRIIRPNGEIRCCYSLADALETKVETSLKSMESYKTLELISKIPQEQEAAS